MKSAAIFMLHLAVASGLKIHEPQGAGTAEPTKADACAECQKNAPFLDKGGDDCSCHASDVARTFVNEESKLPSGWLWHCRPVTGTEGVWQQC